MEDDFERFKSNAFVYSLTNWFSKEGEECVRHFKLQLNKRKHFPPMGDGDDRNENLAKWIWENRSKLDDIHGIEKLKAAWRVKKHRKSKGGVLIHSPVSEATLKKLKALKKQLEFSTEGEVLDEMVRDNMALIESSVRARHQQLIEENKKLKHKNSKQP